MATVTLNSHATRWKPHGCFLRCELPAGLSGWLLDRRSLTARLQQQCPGHFNVRVLSQGTGRPRLDESRVLSVRPSQLAVVREVLLQCEEQPWVFARTVIPVSSLHGRLQRLARLGTQPLGSVLFADPNLQRGNMELAEVFPGQPMHVAATAYLPGQQQALWSRRSVFRYGGDPLLVSEVFLPAFPAGDSRVSFGR